MWLKTVIYGIYLIIRKCKTRYKSGFFSFWSININDIFANRFSKVITMSEIFFHFFCYFIMSGKVFTGMQVAQSNKKAEKLPPL